MDIIPIIVAMKPNDGTYAENALKWGVSGLNIDGGRIGTEKRTYKSCGKSNQKVDNHSKGDTGIGMLDGKNKEEYYVQGRFPANVILDEAAGKILDEQSGISKSSGGSGKKSMGAIGKSKYGKYALNIKGKNIGGLGDTGGASRYFKQIKNDNQNRFLDNQNRFLDNQNRFLANIKVPVEIYKGNNMEYFKTKNGKLHLGNCLDVMKNMKANSVDTIITDPPYGLKFMGKKWDYDVPSIEIWQECLRVCKPGATMLCFAGSRTQHRMAVNIEDAGWILKDCIMWLYGSGFPKATDISKQLDKGVERKVVGYQNYTKPDIKGNAYNSERVKQKPRLEAKITEASTLEAKLWDGWKSHGLKPAYEPILVAMKPNDGTYAENALKWGVSGLNIDGGRIEVDPIIDKSQLRKMNRSKKDEKSGWGMNQNNSDKPQVVDTKGRFPANVILDEAAGKILDEQSGISKSTIAKNITRQKRTTNSVFDDKNCGLQNGSTKVEGHNDSGGASRFFYVAKASKSERNKGVDGIEKELGHNIFDKCSNCGGYIFQNQDRKSACKCENPVREHNKIKGNFHPTVKPIKLIEYLCKLTETPTGGVKFDPFMGSGTMGMVFEKFNYEWIGIEIDKDYCEIAKQRIENIKVEEKTTEKIAKKGIELFFDS